MPAGGHRAGEGVARGVRGGGVAGSGRGCRRGWCETGSRRRRVEGAELPMRRSGPCVPGRGARSEWPSVGAPTRAAKVGPGCWGGDAPRGIRSGGCEGRRSRAGDAKRPACTRAVGREPTAEGVGPGCSTGEAAPGMSGRDERPEMRVGRRCVGDARAGTLRVGGEARSERLFVGAPTRAAKVGPGCWGGDAPRGIRSGGYAAGDARAGEVGRAMRSGRHARGRWAGSRSRKTSGRDARPAKRRRGMSGRDERAGTRGRKCETAGAGGGAGAGAGRRDRRCGSREARGGRRETGDVGRPGRGRPEREEAGRKGGSEKQNRRGAVDAPRRSRSTARSPYSSSG
jgi:hypothetical protein